MVHCISRTFVAYDKQNISVKKKKYSNACISSTRCVMGIPLSASSLHLQILVKCKITGSYQRGLLQKKPRRFCHTGQQEGIFNLFERPSLSHLQVTCEWKGGQDLVSPFCSSQIQCSLLSLKNVHRWCI